MWWLITGDVHSIIQYIPRNMHTVFALLCFVVVIHWLIFPYTSGLLHWHCGNLTIAPVPVKQPWWIWINTSCEFIMNDCITTTKQSTTKTVCIFLGVYCNICVSQAWVTFVGNDIPGMSTDYNFDIQGQLLLNGLVITISIIRLRQYSQLSFIQYMGLYVFSLPNFPVMIVRMCTLPYYHNQIGSMTH